MAETALAIIAGAGLLYSGYSGERQASMARKGKRDQDEAQAKAENAAVSQARQAEEAENRARQKSPDLNVLLARELKPKPAQGSIDANRLLLGRPGLLGY